MYIVDIGAKGGLHPRWEKCTSDFTAILFEPDPREYEELKKITGDNCIILNSALSDISGEIDLNLYRMQVATSVYLPDRDLLSRYFNETNMDGFDILKTVKVPVDSLDNQLQKANLNDIDFIKIDVQGHELSIMKGGKHTLHQVIGVETEVEFLPVYKDQPLFADVDCFLRDAGFEIFDIKRVFRSRDEIEVYGKRKGQLVWGDALYMRPPETILSMPGITAEKIMNAINIYLVYGYPDLAETLLNIANQHELFTTAMSDEVKSLLTGFEVKKVNALPKFKRKRRIYRLLDRAARTFEHLTWINVVTDEALGNKR